MKKILVLLSLTLLSSNVFAAYGCRVGNVSIPNGGSHIQRAGNGSQCETLSCNNGILSVSTAPCKLSTKAVAAPAKTGKK